jgi:hypothetical protein
MPWLSKVRPRRYVTRASEPFNVVDDLNSGLGNVVHVFSVRMLLQETGRPDDNVYTVNAALNS